MYFVREYKQFVPVDFSIIPTFIITNEFVHLFKMHFRLSYGKSLFMCELRSFSSFLKLNASVALKKVYFGSMRQASLRPLLLQSQITP